MQAAFEGMLLLGSAPVFPMLLHIDPDAVAVMRMQHLTPADFAVTARKARILGSGNDDEALIDLLAQEVAAKESPARQIGFCR